jgi:uncharacterized membrane protein YoaK (UPF0700 family)
MRLAAMLCLTAGFVNVAGLLAFKVFTTNVTGHAAVFAEKLAEGDLRSAAVVGLWMLLFLAGAFSCSVYIGKKASASTYRYMLPMIVEVLLLLFVGIRGTSGYLTLTEKEAYAGSLLFAMGMQNAMVSVITGAAVRTTHLTGMFTDLGINLGSLLHAGTEARLQLRQKVVLELTIILFFLSGGIAGGYLFGALHCHTFFVPAALLVVTMFYDYFRVGISRMYHSAVRK